MDKNSNPCGLPKKKLIDKKQGNQIETPGVSFTASNSSNLEGTFIPLAAKDSAVDCPRFFNPKFKDDDEDDSIVRVIEPETEEKDPLLLLFPDLEVERESRKNVSSNMSTTAVTQMLVGKTADFSLLKPSKNLQKPTDRLPPLLELPNENNHKSDV